MENIYQTTAKLSTLKRGEYFRRIIKGEEGKETYTRDEYDRTYKKFACEKHSDVWGNGILLKGSTIVSVGFNY